jgi:antitoxin component YwqK of YwqJK toxin-antitoxin module
VIKGVCGVYGYIDGMVYNAWDDEICVYEVSGRVQNGDYTAYCKQTKNIKCAKYYRGMLYNGYYKSFWENGKVKWDGVLKDDYKHGFEKGYNTHGNLILINKFKYGIFVDSISYE